MVQRLEHCLNHELGEIVVPVKTPVTRSGTERPRAPLLQFSIDFGQEVCRIGGRLRSGRASVRGVTLEIPPSSWLEPNPQSLSDWGTVLDG